MTIPRERKIGERRGPRPENDGMILVEPAEVAAYDEAYRPGGAATTFLWNEGPFASVFREIVRWIPTTSNVVDLGCGSAPLLDALLERRKSVPGYVGLDFSLEALARARERYPAGKYLFEHVDLGRDDLELDRYLDPGGAATTFVALEVLEHVADDLGLLARVPGGCRVVLTVPSYPSPLHVRTFASFGDAWSRYENVLELRRGFVERLEGGYVFALEGVRRGGVW